MIEIVLQIDSGRSESKNFRAVPDNQKLNSSTVE